MNESLLKCRLFDGWLTVDGLSGDNQIAIMSLEGEESVNSTFDITMSGSSSIQCPKCGTDLDNSSWLGADSIEFDCATLGDRLDACLHGWFCGECDIDLFTANIAVLSPENVRPEEWTHDEMHRSRSDYLLHASNGSKSWTVRRFIEAKWSYPCGTVYGPFEWFDVHCLGPYRMLDDVVVPGLGVARHPASGQATWKAATDVVNEFAPIVLSDEWNRVVTDATRTALTREHKENACCELPPEVLHRAIQLALSSPVDEDSPYRSNYEIHPAMRHICDWWNQHAPNVEYRRAAQAVLWVRERGWYESMGEEPGESIQRRDRRDRCAACGDHILVEFQQGRAAYVYASLEPCDVKFTTILGVDGMPRLHVGTSPEECHDDALALQYLQRFPSCHPRLWDELQQEASPCSDSKRHRGGNHALDRVLPNSG